MHRLYICRSSVTVALQLELGEVQHVVARRDKSLSPYVDCLEEAVPQEALEDTKVDWYCSRCSQ